MSREIEELLKKARELHTYNHDREDEYEDGGAMTIIEAVEALDKRLDDFEKKLASVGTFTETGRNLARFK